MQKKITGIFMKAIVCTKYGSPDFLELKEVEKPVPSNNEILIKIFATTVTSGDTVLRSITSSFYFYVANSATIFWR